MLGDSKKKRKLISHLELKNVLLFTLIGLVIFSCQSKKESDTSETDQTAETSVGEPLFTEPLGLAPYTFRRSWDNGIEATLDTVADMGFTSIEGGGGDMDPEEYRKLCESKGLTIPAIGGGYEMLLDSPMAFVERAKILGADYVVTFWIPHKGDVFTFEDAQKAVKDFNTIGKIMSENGLTFCYHAHGYEFQPYGDGTLLDYMMENTNPDYVSFEMDIYWIQFGGGDPVALLEKYGDRWKLMHIKDMEKGLEKNLSGHADPETNVAVGTGELDMPAIIRAAQEAGVAHYFIEDESSRIIKQIPKSIEYLRSLKK